VTGEFDGAIEDAHDSVGGDKCQLFSDCFGRDGVIVEIEADIDGLVRTHGLDPVGGKRM
jgi:hypothetical protein